MITDKTIAAAERLVLFLREVKSIPNPEEILPDEIFYIRIHMNRFKIIADLTNKIYEDVNEVYLSWKFEFDLLKEKRDEAEGNARR